ncbi:MAG: hypothetical protein ACRC50_12335, partial [Gaiella sp.]
TDVRARLGLRSSTFRLGTLRLVPPKGVSAPGPVRLTGTARDVDAPRLERLGADGGWVRGPKLVRAPDGTFTVTLRLTETTDVRVVADGLVAPTVTVAVAEVAE